MISSSARALAARALLLGAATAVAWSSTLAACGTDVNLGGSVDAGLVMEDATLSPAEFGDICAPCATALTCPVAATCVKIAGNLTFCATACPQGSECDPDDVCQLVAMSTGDMVRACIPRSGFCAPAPPPQSESAPLVSCPGLEGPTISSLCKSCDRDDKDCQRNGCYGGWWCNTTSKRCEKPPVSCPS